MWIVRWSIIENNKGMLKHYFEQLKGKWVLVLLGVLGLVLLVYGSGGSKENRTETQPDSQAYFQAAEVYRLQLESDIAALCESVGGVSEVKVLVTLEAGNVNVYAADGGEDYVISGGQGILLSRKMPPVGGVAVVCRGGGDIGVRAELTALIAAALHIGTNRVYISGR